MQINPKRSTSISSAGERPGHEQRRSAEVGTVLSVADGMAARSTTACRSRMSTCRHDVTGLALNLRA